MALFWTHNIGLPFAGIDLLLRKKEFTVIFEKFRQEPNAAAAERWLNQLFQRYHARVATWCFRLTGSRESALDLAQETFLKAYRGPRKISHWPHA